MHAFLAYAVLLLNKNQVNSEESTMRTRSSSSTAACQGVKCIAIQESLMVGKSEGHRRRKLLQKGRRC